MKMIKTDKLVFEYAKRDEEGNIIGMSRAVDEVDLDIEPGQFIAILGHNGSGKSTLAKHMNAILVPTEGTMWVDGKDTKEEEYLWDIRQSAGMVFQNRIIRSSVQWWKKMSDLARRISECRRNRSGREWRKA